MTHHLNYELRSVAYLMARATPTDDIWIGNAVLEAFLSHVRILDDFLGKRTPHRQDVLATDYDPQWKPEYALDPPLRNELDRRIAHLTLRRTLDHAWDKPRLASAVMTRFKAFLMGLDGRHPERAAWIKPVYAEAVDIMQKTRDAPWPRPATPDTTG
jgi:hypothetical protein